MKVASLIKKQEIQIVDQEPETLSSSDVRVDVYAAGICGSDIPRYFQGRVHFFPVVLGHEISGVVSEIGSSVKGVVPGDHVVVIPLMPCGNCRSCAEGKYSLCENYKFIGSSVNGGFATQIVLPEKNLYKLPKQIPHEDSIFFETASVALHAVDLLGDIYGANVAIVGTGTVGLLCAQWSVLKGAKTVVFGRSEYNAKVEGLGLAYCSLRRAITEYEGGFDFVIDAVGYSSSIDSSLLLLRKAGLLSLVGTPSEDVILTSKTWNYINRKELVIKGSWMGYSAPFPGKEWDLVSEAILNNKIRLGDALLNENKFHLNEINKAFDLFKEGKPVRGRVLIYTDKLKALRGW